LAWMVFRRETTVREGHGVSVDEIAAHAAGSKRRFQRIGVALDALPTDAAMLAEAVALARANQADLVLMHVVDGVGGTWYGAQTGDQESRDDEIYLQSLAERLRVELQGQGVSSIEAVLGYGDASTEIVNLARQKEVDLMVLGGHGHRGLFDLLHGYTISGVRHNLDIPIVAVRGGERPPARNEPI
jgi:manganese transport protein